MKYKTIAETMQGAIMSGEIAPGEILPPQCEMAENYNTTYSTISRVIGLLKNRGLIEYAYEREARYKVADGVIIDRLRALKIDEYIHDFIQTMKRLGYDSKEAARLIQKYSEIYEEA